MKRVGFVLSIILISLSLTGCFSLKKSPFYNSEWVMQNLDDKGELYYHHLILSPDHKAMLRVSYADSSNIIVWTGTFKANSKKLVFNFSECVRYENGEVVGKYTAGQLIKYYTGDYLYSLALIGDNEEDKEYHMQLIRPKNYFYGEAKDIFGNPLDVFVKMQ
jgi:hypothetical protein